MLPFCEAPGSAQRVASGRREYAPGRLGASDLEALELNVGIAYAKPLPVMVIGAVNGTSYRVLARFAVSGKYWE